MTGHRENAQVRGLRSLGGRTFVSCPRYEVRAPVQVTVPGSAVRKQSEAPRADAWQHGQLPDC